MQKRMDYLDNLKVLLSFLTISFHTIRGYVDWWWYPVPIPNKSPYLTPYVSIFLAFAMNLYFVIAGYFTPLVFKKFGEKEYHKHQTKRFITPILIFVIIMPFLMYSQYLEGSTSEIGFSDFFFNYYLGFGSKPDDWANPIYPGFNYGHLWFCAHLVLYGIIYSIIIRIITKKSNNISDQNSIESNNDISLNNESIFSSKSISFEHSYKFPKSYAILLFITILTFISFIIRIWFRVSSHMIVFFVFQISLAHFPQYTTYFFIGILAQKYNWLDNIPKKVGNIAIFSTISCVFYIVALNFVIPLGDSRFQTGMNPFSFTYALWEVIMGLSLVVALPFVFKKILNKRSEKSRWIVKHSYLVFILHVPLILVIQRFFIPINLDPILIALIVIIIASISSYFFAFLIKKIPFAKKYF